MAFITGTTGNDTYSGAAGVADTAIIGSLQSRITFRRLAATDNWQTVSGTAGTDTLNSIERVQLEDATYMLRLGSPKRVTGATQDHGLTTFANGDLAVAYTKTVSSVNTLFVQRYNSDGEKLGAEISVDTASAGAAHRLASLPDSSFFAIYTNADAAGSGVYLQRFSAAGAKIGSPILANTFTTDAQTLGDVDVLADNSLVVTWISFGQDGDGQGVYAQRFSAAGTKLGGEFRVNTVTAGNQRQPDVTALADGGYLVSWLSVTPVAQKFTAAGARVGGEISLGTGSQAPLLVASPDGGFFAVRSAGTELRLQKYTAAGGASGEEVVAARMNGTIGLGGLMATELTDGRFAVTWQTNEQLQYSIIFDSQGRAITPLRSFSSGAGASSGFMEATADGGFAFRYPLNGQSGTQLFDRNGLPFNATIEGDESPNTIVGEGDRLSLFGRGGNDVIRGGTLEDVLDGGAGNDTLIGGGGNDIYIADRGDTIVEMAGEGTDTVEVSASYTLTAANVERLVLTGVAAGDLIGNALDNIISGNLADNVINGGQGADTMRGGLGNDTYVVDQGLAPSQNPDLVLEEADAGIDSVISQIDSYTLPANVEHLQLSGLAVQGIGNALGNRITGNARANALDGGEGSDTLIGEAGDDTYVVDTDDLIIENVNGGRDTVIARASWTLGDNLEDLRLENVAGIANGTGNALANAITGNDSANIIDGGAGVDTMNGGLGADTYYVDETGDIAQEFVDGGADIVISTATYTLGAGIENLTLRGETAINGAGNTLNNIIRGNSSANILQGGFGADQVYGGFGNDTLISTDGADTLYGQTGDDTYQVTGTGDTIVELAGQGTDSVIANVSRTYTLDLNIENLTLVGGNVDGFGNTQNNVIVGTAGINLLDGGAGVDRMQGLAGDDTYIVDAQSDLAIENLDEGVDSVVANVAFGLGANVENLTLTGAAFIDGSGNALGNRILGNISANILNGLDGDDVLLGDAGSDRLIGGNGNDRLNGGDGNDFLEGGLGFDAANYYNARAGVTVNLGITDYQNTGAAGLDKLTDIEAIEGSLLGADMLTGNDMDNALYGFGGADILGGGAGNDLLSGGEGNDTHFADAGDDTIDGGAGTDLLSFENLSGNVRFSLLIGGPQNTGAGFDRVRNIENLAGSRTGNDQLFGDETANNLQGLGGDDLLNGAEGADTLNGGDGFDTADYSTALSEVNVDLLNGRALNDGSGSQDVLIALENVQGSQFDDLIVGDTARNILIGNLGADILDGGLGNDVLIGEQGADVFRFTTGLGASNIDRITDYSVADDTVHLSLAIFAGLAGQGALAASAFRSGAAAQAASDRVLYDPTTGALSYDADGTGGAAAVQFAQLTAGLALTSADFFIIA